MRRVTTSPGAGGLREISVATGELATADMVLNIGPQHPSTHGVLRLRLVARRRADRHAPSRSSATCTAAPRSCSRSATTGRSSCWPTGTTGCPRSPTSSAWCSPSSGCWAWRCPSGRSGCAPLLAELNRVLNHLMFLGSYPLEIGAITPIFYAFRERETLQAVMEEVSGGRMHYMFNRVGGLKEDLPAGWTRPGPARGRRGPPAAARHRRPDPRQRDLPGPHPSASACCPREPIAAYGVSGPVARASGVDFDLRRDEPYLAYGELDVPVVVTRTDGRLPTPGSRCCSSRSTSRSTWPTPAWTGCDAARRARSTSGCPRCSRRPRATPTPGPRTRSASTATTWCRAARRRRGG